MCALVEGEKKACWTLACNAPLKVLSSKSWSPARNTVAAWPVSGPLSFVLKAGTERPAVSRWFGWWGPESDVTSCPLAPAPGHSALPAPLMWSCREQKVKLLEAK